MVTEARHLGKTVIMDVKGNDLKMALPCRPDIIKPNLSEFYATFSPEVVVLENEDSEGLKQQVQKKMKELFTEYGIKSIVTRGSRPAWAYDGSTFHEEPMVAAKAINTIGCGDAFTAGFVDSMVKGRPFGDCLNEAMRCGSLKAACIRPGSLY
jgi:1-phosphofructokinase/tagatose 6-phosphate kinase